MKKASGIISAIIVDPATGGMWTLKAKNGQDIDSLKVILLENATDEQMTEATKIN
ncbi:hypothetical protein ACFSJQ_21315 [Vibrio olivae]|uniref:Uncharacterized protein n=1 Tax=Vibrio olivae TaxID=1243002 RepID=A0ABV5HTK3_9VIBR